MTDLTGVARPHMNPAELASYAAGHPLAAAVAAALTITVLVLTWRAARAAGRTVRRLLSGQQPDDVLTFIAAGLITGLQSQGMWRVFRDILHLAPALRVMLFAVFEVAMLTCALRARRSVKAGGSAGVDGAAVWSLASLSGVLSATDAWPSFGGVLARLSAPYAAAFLWERGLSIERQRSGRSTIHWRITPERILVRLGFAEPTDRTATDVDAHRRLSRVARAAQRLRVLRAAGRTGWRLTHAQRRLAAAVEAAVEHAHLATDSDRQEQLLAQIGSLAGAPVLAEITPAAPWGSTRPPLPSSPARLYRVPDENLRQAEEELFRDLAAEGWPGTPAYLLDWIDEDRVPGDEKPVPGVPPAADEHHLKAARIFADEVQAGKVPGIRPIKRKVGVGQPKAREVQAYLRDLINQ